MVLRNILQGMFTQTYVMFAVLSSSNACLLQKFAQSQNEYCISISEVKSGFRIVSIAGVKC